ncbi:MAG: hypothetical protein D3904_08515 [Candidatus Electrothrix sp. EH2]|nr:hypothetical protein [Candidatus Electrothrix sp. EH2]
MPGKSKQPPREVRNPDQQGDVKQWRLGTGQYDPACPERRIKLGPIILSGGEASPMEDGSTEQYPALKHRDVIGSPSGTLSPRHPGPER